MSEDLRKSDIQDSVFNDRGSKGGVIYGEKVNPILSFLIIDSTNKYYCAWRTVVGVSALTSSYFYAYMAALEGGF